MEKTKVTIYDVARKLGVSTTTVNRVLNNKPNVSEKTRQAVLEVIKELNYRPSKTASSLSRSSVKINVIITNNIFDFDKELRRGAEDALRELYDFNLRGEVFEIPASDSPENFLKVMNEQVDQCDGICVIPHNDTASFLEFLESNMKNSATKVCCGVSQITESAIPVFDVICNYTFAGKMAGQMLDLMLKGKGKVAILTNSLVATVHCMTYQGFREYVDASGMEFCGVYEHRDIPERGAEAAARLIRENPDVAGIYIATANSVSICRELERLGVADRIKIVASDVFSDLSELIDRGVVEATIYQAPYMIGNLMVRTMYEMLAEGKEPEHRTFLLDPQIVLKSNKELYSK